MGERNAKQVAFFLLFFTAGCLFMLGIQRVSREDRRLIHNASNIQHLRPGTIVAIKAGENLQVQPVVLSLRAAAKRLRINEDVIGDAYKDDLQFLQESDLRRNKLLIGVLTDPGHLRTLGLAAYSTWVSDIKDFATVYFFMGSCDGIVTNFPGNVVCLDTFDRYPPQRKVFLMWAHLWRHHSNDYNWFMKVDHDSYVNGEFLKTVIDTLQKSNYLSNFKYIGMPAIGRPEERESLGLNGRPYCSGLGYLMNYHTLKAIGPYAGECLAKCVSNHSDTEVGRCVLQHTNVHCDGIKGFPFKQLYYQQVGERVLSMKLSRGGQMKIQFPRFPKGVHFKAGLLHPLKQAEDFYRFHKQSKSYLRPIQPQISMEFSDKTLYKSALNELQGTCVNNALRQLEKSSYYLSECPSPNAEEQTLVPSQALVLTQEGARSTGTEAILRSHDIQSSRMEVQGWTEDSSNGGQDSISAYLLKMKSIFERAIAENTPRLFILEDDVIFLCEFKSQLWQLLLNPRCGSHLFTEHKGGVLLLGAHEVSPDGLEDIEADRSQAFKEYDHDVRAILCYNINSKINGSFAAIYHRSTYDDILAWITKELSPVSPKEYDPKPFDRVYTHLSDLGYIVRGAFPNIMLKSFPGPNTNTLEDPRQITVRLRWYQGKYCRNGEKINP
eukprot:m.73442 g.73442  ORF g.73442 m.73442 type:complete len:664 (-) comp12415_c0_seq2:98-2089(-)